MIFSKKIKEIYKQNVMIRKDPDGLTFYYSGTDFPGLCSTPIAFKNSFGDLLSGYIYYYPNPIDGHLVIFDHGMGCGHRAYMREIEKLCSHGYKVFSYDHTGCAESSGDGIKGFAGSLADLDFAIRAVRSSDEFSGAKLTVMGHSWGAFSTMNSVALHSDISSIVALSGFASVKIIQNEKIGGFLSLWRKDLYELEKQINPEYYYYSAIDSLLSTRTPALIIHSEDDPIVSFKNNFERLRSVLIGKSNVSFCALKGKKHNPQYSDRAVEKLGEFYAALSSIRKSKKKLDESEKAKFVSSFDWNVMTEQDDAVWAMIFDHIDSNR